MEIKVLKQNEHGDRGRDQRRGPHADERAEVRIIKDKDVKVATYDIVYPGISNPILYIRTDKSEDPIDALKKAAKDLADECETFVDLFNKKAKSRA